MIRQRFNRVIHRLWPPGKLPFTLSIAGMLLLAAIFTGSWIKPLTPAWQQRLGFAPRDLFTLHWERMIASALVTSGGIGFWLPLGAAIGLTYPAEKLSGSRRAALAFWLPHLGATIGGSLLTWLANSVTHSSLINAVYTARDVGPSAGYFGCMGLIVSHFTRPWNYRIGFAIITALIGGLVFSGLHGAFIDASAGLAHLVAFPLGWALETYLSSINHAPNRG